jgi:hypothetical protein
MFDPRAIEFQCRAALCVVCGSVYILKFFSAASKPAAFCSVARQETSVTCKENDAIRCLTRQKES